MATNVTLEELKAQTGVADNQLALVCSDEHLNKVAEYIPNYLKYADPLNLKPYQTGEINTNVSFDFLMKSQKVLQVWKSNNLYLATYFRLVEVALQVGDSKVAEVTCNLCRDCKVKDTPSSFPTFEGWLKHKGLQDRDITILKSEGFCTAGGFEMLTKDDIEDREIGFSRGGKRILNKLIVELQETKEATSDDPPVAAVSSVPMDTSSVAMVTSSVATASVLSGPSNDIDYFHMDTRRAYGTLVRCSVKLNAALSLDPQHLAMLLHTAGFISQTLVDEITELNETKKSKGSRLFSAVLNRVKSFPIKFADFVEILRRNRLLYGDILKEIDRVYISG